MNILALDIAKRTGYAYNNGKTVYSGFVDFSTDKNNLRTDTFYKFFEKIVEDHSIEQIAIEEVTFVSNRYAYKSFVEFANEVERLSIKYNVKVFKYNVREVKKTFTGRGNANKQMMMNTASLKLGRNIIDDNEADAIGVLYTHIKSIK